MRVRLILPLLALACVLAAPCVGQDEGYPDTVRFTPSSPTWTIDDPGDTLFLLPLYAWTDQDHIKGASLGFVATACPGSDQCSYDWQFAVDTFYFQPFGPATTLIANVAAVDTNEIPYALWGGFNGCLLGLLEIAGLLLEANVVKHVGDMRIKIFDPALLPQSFEIDVDSAFFPPAGAFKLSRAGGPGFPPQFVKATITVHNLFGFSLPPVISINPASFDFDAVQGWNPASLSDIRDWDTVTQQLVISNAGYGTLNWTARDDAAWLFLCPKSGTGDGSTTLTIDTYGLDYGSYNATITVTDPYASNSPQTAAVTMVVIPPPPPKYHGPDQTYMYYMFAYNPIHIVITMGVTDTIVTASANGVPANVVVQRGGMATLDVPIAPFLEGYGAPIGTVQKTFSVSGTYDDLSTFVGGGILTVKGKNPISPKSWLIPQDAIILYGDADATGNIDIDDAVTLISFIFMGEFLPGPSLMGDCNCSVFTDIDDVVYIISYIFQGGPFPCQSN